MYDKKRHTLWIIDQYAVPVTLSGFTRQYEHAVGLGDLGWQTRIVASPFNHKTHRMDRPVSWKTRRLDINEQGVDFSWVYSTPYQGNNILRYVNMASFLALSQIRALGGNKPDVVMGSSPHLLAALSGWITAKRYGVPFILEVRDLWPESLIQLGLCNPAIIKALEWIEKFLYQRADAIVALTEGIREGIIKKGVDDSKITLIPNGAELVDLPEVEAIKQVRRTFGWDGKFVVGWIGAHGAANGLDILVDAARLLSERSIENIQIVFIGDGPEKPRLVESAAGLSNIEFLEPLPKSKIYSALQAMNAGVIVHMDTAAVRGARPNKLFDYMAVGLPIVSNLQGETERLVSESGAGITVETLSANKLADAMYTLSNSPEQADLMGSRGREFLADTHDRRNLVAHFAELLDQVMRR